MNIGRPTSVDLPDPHEVQPDRIGQGQLRAYHDNKVPQIVIMDKGWLTFPFAVVYREIAEDEIEIAAVAHLKRQHRYWSKR